MTKTKVTKDSGMAADNKKEPTKAKKSAPKAKPKAKPAAKKAKAAPKSKAAPKAKAKAAPKALPKASARASGKATPKIIKSEVTAKRTRNRTKPTAEASARKNAVKRDRYAKGKFEVVAVYLDKAMFKIVERVKKTENGSRSGVIKAAIAKAYAPELTGSLTTSAPRAKSRSAKPKTRAKNVTIPARSEIITPES